jgi:fimbrial chaperone protein
MMYRTLLSSLIVFVSQTSFGFSALVSPPRIEGQQNIGKTYRNVIEITNTSEMSEKYTFKTADWTLDHNGGAIFQDQLSEESCRPWVAIQSHELTLKPNQRFRYRFEVKIPQDTPIGECRFAIMVEGEPKAPKGGIGLPVSGQIGVIVYLGIGDAKADVHFLEATTKRAHSKQQPLPNLMFQNQGTAHARLSGMIEGIDAAQQRLVFNPSSDPILPKTSRTIMLYPIAEADQPIPTIQYPLTLKGILENQQQQIPIDIVITPTSP